MFTEILLATFYTEAEQKEIEAMFMGTRLEARKRYQGTCSYSQQRAQSLDRRQRSLSRSRYGGYDPRPRYGGYDPRPRYGGFDPRSQFDRFKSPGRREESG